MLSKDTSCVFVKYPQKPPAKVSPAPVGSKTSANGNAYTSEEIILRKDGGKIPIEINRYLV